MSRIHISPVDHPGEYRRLLLTDPGVLGYLAGIGLFGTLGVLYCHSGLLTAYSGLPYEREWHDVLQAMSFGGAPAYVEDLAYRYYTLKILVMDLAAWALAGVNLAAMVLGLLRVFEHLRRRMADITCGHPEHAAVALFALYPVIALTEISLWFWGLPPNKDDFLGARLFYWGLYLSLLFLCMSTAYALKHGVTLWQELKKTFSFV